MIPAGLATAPPSDAPLNAFPARNLGLSGGIDAAATLYCVFPLESSAKRNKKAVLCTAVFVIRATICEQVPTVADTTKATRKSGFLVALCARDSGGIRTHDPQLRRLLLYPTELRNQTCFVIVNCAFSRRSRFRDLNPRPLHYE